MVQVDAHTPTKPKRSAVKSATKSTAVRAPQKSISISATDQVTLRRHTTYTRVCWKGRTWKASSVWHCEVAAEYRVVVFRYEDNKYGYLSRNGLYLFTNTSVICAVAYSLPYDRVYARTADGHAVLLDARMVWRNIAAKEDPYVLYFGALVGTPTRLRTPTGAPVVYEDRDASFSYRALYERLFPTKRIPMDVFIRAYEEVAFVHNIELLSYSTCSA